MIVGQVRHNLPRVTLALPGRNGDIMVEFVFDTGFNGELVLPRQIVRDLSAARATQRPVVLADGFERDAPQCFIELNWNEEPRKTEIFVMDGRPLLGNGLLEGCSVNIDMVNGGEVIIEFP